jgi:hypothetical protein
MNGADDETKIVEVWPLERPHFEIGVCSYHGWPLDIGLIDMLHWHLFHRAFYYLVRTLCYQPPFDVML